MMEATNQMLMMGQPVSSWMVLGSNNYDDVACLFVSQTTAPCTAFGTPEARQVLDVYIKGDLLLAK